MEALLASVAVPAWAIAVGTLALFLLLVLWLRSRAGAGDAFASFAQLALVLVVGSLGFFGLRYLDEEARGSERNAFAQRASALLAQTSQSGMLSCVDGSTNETLNEACEKALFSEPPRTAAALALTRQRLAFIADVVAYPTGRELPLRDQIDNLRTATEADPFGFVAQILAEKENCTSDSCARFSLLRNSSHVQENLKEKKFEILLAKHLGKIAEISKPSAATSSSGEVGSINDAPALDHPMVQSLGIRAPSSETDAQTAIAIQPATAPVPRPKQKNVPSAVGPATTVRSAQPVLATPASQFAPTLPPPSSLAPR